MERGVQITEPEKKTGKECAEAYEAWKSDGGLRFSTKDIDDFISRAKSVAEQMPETIEYNKENWDKVFPDGKVMTPIGEIKIGEHQFVKTEKNKRTAEIALAKATLERPNIVIEEYDKRPDSDRDTVMLFVKTFVKEDGTTYRHYESVTVQQGDVEASISSHYLRENQLREKLKAGKVLYDATSLDASRQTSLENPANTDSGAPSSDKDNTESSEKQEKNTETTGKGSGPKSNYEVIKEAREMVSGEKQPFSGYVSSEYYRGETEDGEPYVIRVSDHPAKKDNFDLYEDNEGKVLSLVFTDDLEGDFEEWKKRFEGIEDDDTEQIVFDSKTIDLDKLREGIDHYKKTGKTFGTNEAGEFVDLDSAGNSVRFSTVDQTETGNFKNWFGDWKNDPEHASKIVGKDGRPLVVYHGGGFGQPDDFYDTYTWDNEGAGGWFTPNRDYAKTYTTRYDDNLEDLPPIEVYLNIRNPFEMGNVERLIIEDDKPTPVLHEIAQKLGVRKWRGGTRLCLAIRNSAIGSMPMR